jgi:hypothetical protein
MIIFSVRKHKAYSLFDGWNKGFELLEIVENMRETLAGFLGVATRGWKTEI